MADISERRRLFAEFPPVSTSDWEKKIQDDLKGADYEKKLIWRTPEGIRMKPYYRSENLEGKEYLSCNPGEFPFVRGNKLKSNDWEIRQDIRLDDIDIANHKSLFVLNRGISSLGFITPPYRGSSLLQTPESMQLLLKDIYIDCIRLYFVCGYNAPAILEYLRMETERRGLDKEGITGAVDFDPLGYLTRQGNFSRSEKEDFAELAAIIRFAEEFLPAFKSIGINGYFFTNAGANIVQEMAFSLSIAAEYLHQLTESGFTPDSIARQFQFNLGVGPNYFMEIAKIRSFRYLWAKLMEAYKPKQEDSMKADIHSITSEWNQTIYDPYVNILRATTESMAAVIGGTDSLTVRPFTFSYQSTTKFSGRLARNIQIILKEEAYMGKIIDPAAGSYYIENITDSLIEEAWKLFLHVEEQGGYLSALKKGIIQKEINTILEEKTQHIAHRRTVMVGTNQYANTRDKVLDAIDFDIAFPEPPGTKTLVEPIRKYRGSISFEKLRLATEKHSGTPKVFMLPLGDPVMRKARSAFSVNFFSCAGYEIIDNHGFDSVEEGIRAAHQARADMVVVCSSDEEYARLVPKIQSAINPTILLVVAGAPACMDDLKKQGIEYFIHIRSDVLAVLTTFHNKLGINPL